jgi:cytochrome c oxidase cbb3-type subunit 3
MPPWGPVLGPKKISEAVAYILSHHVEGEPIEVQDAWIPRPPQ